MAVSQSGLSGLGRKKPLVWAWWAEFCLLSHVHVEISTHNVYRSIGSYPSRSGDSKPELQCCKRWCYHRKHWPFYCARRPLYTTNASVLSPAMVCVLCLLRLQILTTLHPGVGYALIAWGLAEGYNHIQGSYIYLHNLPYSGKLLQGF